MIVSALVVHRKKTPRWVLRMYVLKFGTFKARIAEKKKYGAYKIYVFFLFLEVVCIASDPAQGPFHAPLYRVPNPIFGPSARVKMLHPCG